ncbi:MAG: hypothetical protein AAF798_14665 [Bacteroidota bacterium]
MRYIIVSFLGFITLASFAQDSTATNQLEPLTIAYEYQKWEDFRSYEGKFRVLIPGAVSTKEQTLETGVGELTYHTAYCELKDKNADNLVYIISYCDYPDGGMHSDSTELLGEFFAATMEGAAASVEGAVVYEQTRDFREYPGRVWRVDYLEGKAVIKTRAFLVGNRFYSLQTITTKERSLNRSSERFFSSFRLFGG